MNHIITLDRYC